MKVKVKAHIKRAAAELVPGFATGKGEVDENQNAYQSRSYLPWLHV